MQNKEIFAFQIKNDYETYYGDKILNNTPILFLQLNFPINTIK